MFHSALRPAALTSAQSGTCVVRRRGFTILELMIVLTLLVAITGLVMPSVINRLGDSLAAASLDQIEATASECRSKAQQDGRALRLIAKERNDGTVGLYIEEIDESETISGAFDELTGDGLISEGDIGIAEAWETQVSSPVYVLPLNFSFSRSLPEAEDGLFVDPSSFEDTAVGGGPAGDAPQTGLYLDDREVQLLTLAVYLPDGTAIVERPLYFMGQEQTWAIEISRWTGSVTATRVLLEDEIDFDGGGFDENALYGDPDDEGADGRRGNGP